MATEKQIKGVIVPRHDTAINWAKATNFQPRKGELIVFDADATNVSYTIDDITTSKVMTNTDKTTSTLTECNSSDKVRFKFGDGNTNVNLLPFVSSESATQEWAQNYIEAYVNQFEPIALLEITKSGKGGVALEDIYPVQNDATLKTTGANETVYIGEENLVTSIPNKGVLTTYSLSLLGTEVTLQSSSTVSLIDGYAQYTLKLNSKSLTQICDSSSTPVVKVATSKLALDTDYILRLEFDPTEANATQIILRNAYMIDITNTTATDAKTSRIVSDANGNLNSSAMRYPNSYIMSKNTNSTITAEYDTEYKVDQSFDKTSVIPQSGIAVQEALDDMIYACEGDTLSDIPTDCTAKLVVLY